MSRRRQGAAQMIAVQRARQLQGQPTYGFFGDVVGAVTSIIPGPIDDIIVGAGRKIFGGGGRREVTSRADCPPGFRPNPQTGVCELAGATGAIQRFLPGGQTGTLPQLPATDAYGNAVMGSFGVPAIQPAQASSMTLRCPPGSVLGKDNLCYQKGSIPSKFRKWKPARKPPISAKDWKALQTADRVKNKAKTVATKAGYSCRRK